MAFILNIGAMKRSQKAIYNALVGLLGEGRQPLLVDIMKVADYSEPQVKRAIYWLEEHGFIRVNRQRKYNQYEILR